ncbi:MAG TPA: flagellar export chaperone FliS [Candidatus Sumerlaeota bacterium]|nr:flagellar export chaperone FliS [Candidatus Sumerlaeota bacterium]
MAQKLSKAYLLTKVLTASRHEVIVYLYEGAISYLHRAAQALRDQRHGHAARHVQRAISILIELSGGLDYSRGGHLALRLEAVYNHLIESLTLAAANADLEAVESCSGILSILHDAWRQASQMEHDMAATADHALRISA